jgi:hypothetical protein
MHFMGRGWVYGMFVDIWQMNILHVLLEVSEIR